VVPPSLPPSFPYLIDFRPEALFEPFFGLIKSLVILEAVQVGHHAHDLGETVCLKTEGGREGGREGGEGRMSKSQTLAAENVKEERQEGRGEGGKERWREGRAHLQHIQKFECLHFESERTVHHE